MAGDYKDQIRNYYESTESRLGYKLFLNGAQHFGYYPESAKGITEKQAQGFHHDLLAKSLELPAGSNLLDAGCGQGIVSIDLATRYKFNITGIDIVPYIIERAKKNLAAQPSGVQEMVEYKLMSYLELDMPENSFDGLYTVETLSHSPDLGKTLKELFRVLKPNGKAVFFEYRIAPDSEFSPKEKQYYELIKNGSSMLALDDFRENNFSKLLSSTGFSIISETNISENARKSLKRLRDYALIPYSIIKLLGLEKRFINATTAVQFYNQADKGLLEYFCYVVSK